MRGGEGGGSGPCVCFFFWVGGDDVLCFKIHHDEALRQEVVY